MVYDVPLKECFILIKLNSEYICCLGTHILMPQVVSIKQNTLEFISEAQFEKWKSPNTEIED